MLFFFFQAEDGIRDLTVTGVQTCALPISALGLEVVEGTVVVVWVASRADLHGLQTQGGDFVQHGVKGEMFIDGIKHADRNLAQVTGRLGSEKAWKRGVEICRVGEHLTPRDRSRQQTARGSQKLPPSDGGVLGLLPHACPRQTRQRNDANVSVALYVTVTHKQASKIDFLLN